MTDSANSVTVSREELFRQVWTTPMNHLSAQYGISGNGLAKICDRLRIPYPPRGWWARKAAGKKVAYYRLPKPDVDTPTSVQIARTPPRPEPPPEARDAVVQAKSAIDGVVVSDSLRRPYPIIARWIAEHERQLQEARRGRTRGAAPSWKVESGHRSMTAATASWTRCLRLPRLAA